MLLKQYGITIFISRWCATSPQIWRYLSCTHVGLLFLFFRHFIFPHIWQSNRGQISNLVISWLTLHWLYPIQKIHYFHIGASNMYVCNAPVNLFNHVNMHFYKWFQRAILKYTGNGNMKNTLRFLPFHFLQGSTDFQDWLPSAGMWYLVYSAVV